MRQYLDIVKTIFETGTPRSNRTGERTFGEFGFTFAHDMRTHFPILSTKAVPFKSVIAELIGFVNGVCSADAFRYWGTSIWDANANDPGKPEAPNAWLDSVHRTGKDDLGRIYGVQWLGWESIKLIHVEAESDKRIVDTLQANGYRKEVVTATKGSEGVAGHPIVVLRKEINQLENLIEGIKRDPFGRRHIVSAWNPGELKEMALPPCHDFFQVNVKGDDTGKPIAVDLFCHMRSVDVFLGMPFNIASYGALLHMIAHLVGLEARNLHFFFGDTHIYESHLPEMLVQSRRTPNEYDKFGIKPRFQIGYTETVERDEKDVHRALHGEMTREDFHEYAPRQWGESQEAYEERCDTQGCMPASPLTNLSQFEPSNINLRGYNHQGKLTGRMAV